LFGETHPAAKIARNGPWSMLSDSWSTENQDVTHGQPDESDKTMEIVKDFDRSHSSYIG